MGGTAEVKTAVSNLTDKQVKETLELLIKNLAGNQKPRLSRLTNLGIVNDREVKKLLAENSNLENQIKDLESQVSTVKTHLQRSTQEQGLDFEQNSLKSKLQTIYSDVKKSVKKSKGLSESARIGNVTGVSEYQLLPKEVDTLTQHKLNKKLAEAEGKELRERIINNDKG